MKKILGVKNGLFPMPVLMIGTYNEDGTLNNSAESCASVCRYWNVGFDD